MAVGVLVAGVCFAGGAAAQSPNDNVPMMSPFGLPDPTRPLPPPASLAGVEPMEKDAVERSIEETIGETMRDAMVTTASKRAQRLQDVPMTVAWIPGSELEGTGAFTLCDAIQYFPGLECRRGAMRKSAVSARGLGSNFLSNRMLLLKDGRPLTDPWTGQFYADETTPLTNVKQVEVIRGPGSALYGSNAFSGVINIIEKKPSDLMRDGRPFGAEGRILAGQFGTYRLQTAVAGKAGPVEALVNYYGMHSDGAELFNDAERGIVDHNQYSNVQAVGGQVRVGDLSLSADYTDAELGRPGGRQISTIGNCGRCHYTANDVEYTQNLNASVQLDTKVNDWLRVFGQGYTLYKRRVVDLENMVTGELEPALGKRNRFGGEARALLSFGNLNFTVGGDVKHDLVNNQNVLAGLNAVDPETQTRRFDTQQTVFGAFVDAEFRPVDRVSISAGARYDAYQIPANVWTQATDQISPRASVVFHALEDLSLRLNYGRAFRAPTLAELAINQQMYAATLLGNPDLRAETLDTVEASIDYWPFERNVRLTATGFYNVAQNFINMTFDQGSTSQFKNVGNAVVQGMELEAAAQIPAINASFDVAYQLLHPRAIDYEGRSSWLDYAPRHRVYARGRANFGKMGFGELFAIYAGSRFDPGSSIDPDTGRLERVELPGYVTVGARVGVNITDGVAFSVLGSNLFNAQYEEMHGFPASPLGVFSELRVEY